MGLSQSRKIDLTAIENTDTTYLQQDIQAGNLEKAITNLEKLIKDSTMDTAQQKQKNNPWFNQQCSQAKMNALTSLDRAVKQPTKSNLQNYYEARKQYKYTVKKERSFPRAGRAKDGRKCRRETV